MGRGGPPKPMKNRRPPQIFPTFIEISDGKLHHVNVLDSIIPEADFFCVIDRGYVDFARLRTPLRSHGRA